MTLRSKINGSISKGTLNMCAASVLHNQLSTQNMHPLIGHHINRLMTTVFTKVCHYPEHNHDQPMHNAL